MTDQLDGRDLDRACAEAMGWTVITEHDEGSTLIGCVCGEARFVPCYSIDPSTQAEKLAWLNEPGQGVQIVFTRDNDTGLWSAMLFTFGADRSYETTGTTIDQALARLVVSVAKAKKEQSREP